MNPLNKVQIAFLDKLDNQIEKANSQHYSLFLYIPGDDKHQPFFFLIYMKRCTDKERGRLHCIQIFLTSLSIYITMTTDKDYFKKFLLAISKSDGSDYLSEMEPLPKVLLGPMTFQGEY